MTTTFHEIRKEVEDKRGRFEADKFSTLWHTYPHARERIAELYLSDISHQGFVMRDTASVIINDETLTLDQALEVGKLGVVRKNHYLLHRLAEGADDTSHDFALRQAQELHICDFATKIHDGRDPILGAGTVTVVRTCECGREFVTESRYNWTGD